MLDRRAQLRRDPELDRERRIARVRRRDEAEPHEAAGGARGPRRRRRPHRDDAARVRRPALRLRAEVVLGARTALVEDGHLGRPVRREEAAHALHERRIVDAVEPPLRDGERLVARGRRRGQRLELGPRRGALVVDVAALDVDVRLAGVVLRGRVPGDARVAAGERAPEDPQPRERVRELVAAVQRRHPERLQLRVDRRFGAAVEDQVDAPERLLVALGRVGRVLGRAARRVGRVVVLVVVHLGHRPDVDALPPDPDRVVQRGEVGVALARRDVARRDRLAAALALRAEVEHRDRAEPPKQDRERRAERLALAPAEETLVDQRVLAGLVGEARDAARDPEDRARRGRGGRRADLPDRRPAAERQQRRRGDGHEDE